MSAKIDSVNILQQTGPDQQLQVVAKLCSAGGCPTIYRTSDEDLLVQGYTDGGHGVDLPDGEELVDGAVGQGAIEPQRALDPLHGGDAHERDGREFHRRRS